MYIPYIFDADLPPITSKNPMIKENPKDSYPRI